MTYRSIFCLAGIVSMTWALSARAEPLTPGDIAPAFELQGSDGRLYKLADFKDRKVVVVAWFPKAFTGG